MINQVLTGYTSFPLLVFSKRKKYCKLEKTYRLDMAQVRKGKENFGSPAIMLNI